MTHDGAIETGVRPRPMAPIVGEGGSEPDR